MYMLYIEILLFQTVVVSMNDYWVNKNVLLFMTIFTATLHKMMVVHVKFPNTTHPHLI